MAERAGLKLGFVRTLHEIEQPQGTYVLKNRWLLAAVTLIHRILYVSSGGYVGGRIFWIKILLLINVGRRTGRTRVTPLLYVEDGDHWIVAASNAGNDRYPAWWFNLQNSPEARIQVGRQMIDVRWRQATHEECERLWPKLARSYPFFPEYLEGTEREIPIVMLERAPELAAQTETTRVLPAEASEGATEGVTGP